VDRAATYTSVTASAPPGATLLAFTDGLVERRGEDILKGVGRVAEELRTWRSGAPLDDLCDHLVRSVAPEPQLDDVCVLAVGRPRTPEGPDPALA